jgi:hypothetical protein
MHPPIRAYLKPAHPAARLAAAADAADSRPASIAAPRARASLVL